MPSVTTPLEWKYASTAEPTSGSARRIDIAAVGSSGMAVAPRRITVDSDVSASTTVCETACEEFEEAVGFVVGLVSRL